LQSEQIEEDAIAACVEHFREESRRTEIENAIAVHLIVRAGGKMTVEAAAARARALYDETRLGSDGAVSVGLVPRNDVSSGKYEVSFPAPGHPDGSVKLLARRLGPKGSRAIELTTAHGTSAAREAAWSAVRHYRSRMLIREARESRARREPVP